MLKQNEENLDEDEFMEWEDSDKENWDSLYNTHTEGLNREARRRLK